jgi:hypothetical protein
LGPDSSKGLKTNSIGKRAVSPPLDHEGEDARGDAPGAVDVAGRAAEAPGLDDVDLALHRDGPGVGDDKFVGVLGVARFEHGRIEAEGGEEADEVGVDALEDDGRGADRDAVEGDGLIARGGEGRLVPEDVDDADGGSAQEEVDVVGRGGRRSGPDGQGGGAPGRGGGTGLEQDGADTGRQFDVGRGGAVGQCGGHGAHDRGLGARPEFAPPSEGPRPWINDGHGAAGAGGGVVPRPEGGPRLDEAARKVFGRVAVADRGCVEAAERHLDGSGVGRGPDGAGGGDAGRRGLLGQGEHERAVRGLEEGGVGGDVDGPGHGEDGLGDEAAQFGLESFDALLGHGVGVEALAVDAARLPSLDDLAEPVHKREQHGAPELLGRLEDAQDVVLAQRELVGDARREAVEDDGHLLPVVAHGEDLREDQVDGLGPGRGLGVPPRGEGDRPDAHVGGGFWEHGQKPGLASLDDDAEPGAVGIAAGDGGVGRLRGVLGGRDPDEVEGVGTDRAGAVGDFHDRAVPAERRQRRGPLAAQASALEGEAGGVDLPAVDVEDADAHAQGLAGHVACEDGDAGGGGLGDDVARVIEGDVDLGQLGDGDVVEPGAARDVLECDEFVEPGGVGAVLVRLEEEQVDLEEGGAGIVDLDVEELPAVLGADGGAAEDLPGEGLAQFVEEGDLEAGAGAVEALGARPGRDAVVGPGQHGQGALAHEKAGAAAAGGQVHGVVARVRLGLFQGGEIPDGESRAQAGHLRVVLASDPLGGDGERVVGLFEVEGRNNAVGEAGAVHRRLVLPGPAPRRQACAREHGDGEWEAGHCRCIGSARGRAGSRRARRRCGGDGGGFGGPFVGGDP